VSVSTPTAGTTPTTTRGTIARNTLAGILLAFAAVWSLLSPAPASAAAQDPGYHHMDVPFEFGGNPHTGGYIRCPAGMQALAWGGTVTNGYTWLTAGVTTWNSDGAFVTAHDGFHQGALQASVRCVAADRLRGQTLVTGTTKGAGYTGSQPFIRAATCPSGTVPFGGGGWVTGSSYQDVIDFGSFPNQNGWWIGRVTDLENGKRDLWFSTHCLPRNRLGNVVTVMETVTGPNTRAATNVSVGARCPSGYFAFAGGSWFRLPGDLYPSAGGRIQVSNMAADDRGWFGKGQTTWPNMQLSTRVMCTDRLG
jgi:hypothetical protein